MRIFRAIGWTVAALAGSTAASAQDIGQDVRCLLVSNAFSGAAKDPKARQVAALTGLFYLGKLDGRLTDAQLEARIREEQKKLPAANAGTTMQACGKHVEERGKALQSIGRRLVPPKK